MSDIHPHGGLFRFVFSRPEEASGALKSVLPPTVSDAIDWSTLTLENAHYVDEKLRGLESDLVYSARLAGRDVILYLVFEHQSTSDPLMAFRMLRYVVRVWDGWLTAHAGVRRLPAVVPVVLSNAEGGWKHSTSMLDLIEMDPRLLEALKPHLPDFSFLLDDLSRSTDQAIQERAMRALGILTLLLLRYGRRETHLLPKLRDWWGLLKEVWAGPDPRRVLLALVRYMVLVTGEETLQDYESALVPVLGEGAREVVMTLGEQLIAEGIQKGIQQGIEKGIEKGRAEGRAEALLELLEIRGFVVSDEHRSRVFACTDDATFSRWMQRALAATTTEAVLD